MTEEELPVAVDPLLAEVEAVEAARPARAAMEPEGVAPALRSITVAVESVPGEDHLAAESRFRLIAHLDDDAQRVLAPLMAGEEDAGAESDVVAAARDLFGALLDAYHACTSAMEVGATAAGTLALRDEAHARLVRSGAQRVKWERCAGGPSHAQLWQWLGASLARSNSNGPSGLVPANVGSPTGAVTVEREYLRAVAYYGAGLEHLSLAMMCAVDRLVDYVLPMLQFGLVTEPGAVAGTAYFVAPSLADAPRRALPMTEQGEGAWYLSTRVAVDALHELAVQFERGGAPHGVESTPAQTEWLPAALVHLVRNWSDASPVRRYRRHVLRGKLTAVRGIRDLCQLFAGESVSHLTEWEFRDGSRGGIGAAVPPGAAEPGVGELVGILPHDGEVWQLGMVRRSWRESDQSVRVGVEAVSLRPILASADDGLVRTEVFVCDPLSRGEAVRLAAPANTLRPGVPVFLTASGSIQKLKPLDASLSGDGFELRVYQVL